MPASSIRIAPVNSAQPQSAPMPLEQAARWNSPFDNDWLEPNVGVFMTRPAYIRVCVHACSASIEVGGALIGDWCTVPGTGEQFVVVKHVLPARHTRQGAVYLTFTQDSIVDLHDQIEKRFPGERIVGWYHTHPQMGVFLSHYDTWLHSHFFPEPWQVALVVEPFSSIAGFFIRQHDGNLDPTRYFGFYEMDAAEGHSIVRWHNLTQGEIKIKANKAKEAKPLDPKAAESAQKAPAPEIRLKADKPQETKAQEVKLKEVKLKDDPKGGKTL